jgi:hypothetical protein
MSRTLCWRYFDDLPDNIGFTKTYRNGSYTGDWYAGRRHGQGIRIYRCAGHKGAVSGYKGSWRNGRRHGWGLRRYADGGWFEGFFAYGQRHGPGVRQYANGQQKRATWSRSLNLKKKFKENFKKI